MDKDDVAVHIQVEADTQDAMKKLGELEVRADAFGQALTKALKSSIVDGKGLSDVMRKLALTLSDMALDAALAPMEKGFGGLFSKFMSESLSFGNFKSSPEMPTKITPFATGGIVSSPTLFPMSGNSSSIGLMGEAGSEAILPLARGADGTLGVASSANNQPMVNITFNISTPDIDGFSRSESQISAMLARAVGRGRRAL